VLFAKAIIVLLFLIYFLMFNSCKKIKIERVISQDSQVYRNLDYSSQKLDSCYVNDFLENEPSLIKFKEDISSFYRRRNFQFAWFSNNIFTVGANTFINALYEYQVIFHDSRPPQKSGHKDKLEIILNSHIKSLLDDKNQEKIHEGAKTRDSQHVTRRQSVS